MNTFTTVRIVSIVRIVPTLTYARYASGIKRREINHHNIVRLVAVRFGETYFLFLKTSECIATAKATHDECGAQTQR